MVVRTASNYFMEEMPTNLRSLERTFVLELMEGVKKYQVDTRLVDGNNHLSAIKNPQLPMWALKLEKGTLPEGLKSCFTSFEALRKHVELYFLKRGVKVTEIID